MCGFGQLMCWQACRDDDRVCASAPKGTQAEPEAASPGAKLEPATWSCPEIFGGEQPGSAAPSPPHQHIPTLGPTPRVSSTVPNLPSFHPYPAGLPAHLP